MKDPHKAEAKPLWKWKGIKKKKMPFPFAGFLEENLRKTRHPVVGAGGGAGIGCGVGVGFGLVGGLGYGGCSWNHLHMVFGVGMGCGVGLGFGYGQGLGLGFSLESLQSSFSGRSSDSRKWAVIEI